MWIRVQFWKTVLRLVEIVALLTLHNYKWVMVCDDVLEGFAKLMSIQALMYQII